MYIKYVFLLVGVFASSQTFAIGFKNFYHMFYPNDKKIVIEALANPGAKSAHIYSATVVPIDNPYSMKPIAIPKGEEGAILFTPAKTIVRPNKNVKFTFFYHGPQDDKERYYLITWRDEALSMPDASESAKKNAYVKASATVATVLVVNPRQPVYIHALKGDKIINSGNVTLNAFAFGACTANPKENCTFGKPILPNTEVKIKNVDTKSEFSVGYWKDESNVENIRYAG